MPSPVRALTATESATPSRRASRAAVRSLVVEVGLGQHERDRHAAGRRQRGEALEPARLGSGSGSVTSARSTLAASTWPPVPRPAARRTIVPGAARSGGDRAAVVEPTQSPVTGVSVSRPRAGTSWARRHRVRPASRPRYCASTRAGVCESNGGSPLLRRRTRRGAGTGRVGPAPVQAVVAKVWRRCVTASNGTAGGGCGYPPYSDRRLGHQAWITNVETRSPRRRRCRR